MNDHLFRVADFLSRPPDFYLVIIGLVLATLLIPFRGNQRHQLRLSVTAIIITGVVLIQGYRDTAAMNAKLDEIIVSLKEPNNNVVGLEHESPEKIEETLQNLEQKAVAG